MRLLFDVDGVIADFTGFYLDLCKVVSGCVYAREQVTCWSMKEALDLPDWVEEDVNARIHEPGAGLAIEPLPGAVEAVLKLTREHDVYFVTSPFSTAPTWVRDRELWLRRYFGKEQARKVVHTDRKYLIVGDVLVDDKPSHVEGWQAAHPNGLAVLWHAVHNSRSPIPPPSMRASSWPQLGHIIHGAELHRAAGGM